MGIVEGARLGALDDIGSLDVQLRLAQSSALDEDLDCRMVVSRLARRDAQRVRTGGRVLWRDEGVPLRRQCACRDHV